MGKRLRLTSEDVARLEVPVKGYTIAWDSEVPGFGARVTTTGKRTYILNYRTRAGRQRRITLGTAKALTASQARKLARQELANVARGEDPRAVRILERELEGRTFAALADLYLEHLRKRNTPPTDRTLRIYERDYLGRWLLPAFGSRPVAKIGRDEVIRLHRRVGKRSGHYLANRVLQFVVAMGKYGAAIGWWPDGKALTVFKDRFPEKPRTATRAVMLTNEQLARLLDAISEAEGTPGANQYALACIRFLLWTGWRPEEAFNLKWEYLDLEAGRARLTHTKTRRDGEERTLLAEALAVLRSVERIAGHPYVFVGNKPKKPLTHVNRTWHSLRQAAGLMDLGGKFDKEGVYHPGIGPMRLRDLRHNFIAQLVSRGYDLGMVGKLVGHKSRATTARYGGFAPDVLRSIGDEGFRALRKDIENARRGRG